MAKEITLSGRVGRGLTALVDDEDYDRLCNWSWSAARRGKLIYAQRGVWRNDGPNRLVYMHRQVLELLDAPHSVLVDHINGNTLDNRRENLRMCRGAQNIARIPPRPGKRFKGTTWNKQSRRWVAQIRSNYKHVNLGYFDTEEEAARAYDLAAYDAWGEFAYLNFPESAS